MNTVDSTASKRIRAIVRSLLIGLSLLGSLAHAQVCTVVQLQLGQQAALEREAFDAHLTLNNSLGDALQNLFVNISVTDANGIPADSQFFIKINSLNGTNAVDGTGVVQSSGTADIHWLIIPSTGAGGSNTLGLGYSVTANISYLAAGAPQTVQTLPASITVVPQPALKLEYVLPYEVFAQEPLLPQTITAPQPFPLGVRVTNVGFGPAHSFQINSAQPQIVDNKQGLLVNYQLLGTVVGGVSVPNTLLIPFGDIAAGGVSQAEWSMQSSLSGRFIQFTSTFTHAAELGGQLTSLIQSVTTYTLLKDVLVDLPGRDSIPDFLVNESLPRAAMQTLLDGGNAPAAEFILESDRPAPLPVLEVPAILNGTLGSSNSTLTLTFANAISSGAWVHAVVPFASGNVATLVSAQRSDGKAIDPHNVWISKHFRKSDLSYLYWINIVDYASSANSYALQFNPGSLAQPPGAVKDLTAGPAPGGGQIQLNWTAPGDSGYTGNILGGRYFVEVETNPAAAFSPSTAQISFATTTSAGNRENYLATGLLGNATLYAYLWTQNPAVMNSPISNGTTLYTLPNPPSGLVPVSVSNNSVMVSWQAGKNLTPVAYSISLSTSQSGNAVSSPLQSSSFLYSFGGLTPNTSYFVSGVGINTITGAASPVNQLAVVVTSASIPSSGAFAAIATSSLTANWLTAGNPPDTEFFAELSTSPSRAPVLIASGWVRASSFTFAGLLPATTYYGQVKARSRTLVETAYADLGAIKTAPVDNMPPRTSFAAGAPQFGASPIYVTTATLLSLSAVDDKVAAGDGLGLGVARTLFAVDSTSFTTYTGTFTLVALGTHTIQFYSVDVLGNAEVVRSTTVAVDAAAPIARLDALGSSTTVAGSLFAAFGSSLAVTASDPVVAGAASGVAGVQLTVDGVTAAYTAPFELAAGTHSIAFGAFDNLGNGLNVLSTETVAVDGLPPRTAAAFGEPKFTGARLYLSSTTPIQFAALDDLAAVGDGRGAGVGQTFLAVDATTYAAVVSTISFSSEGVHGLSWFSRDLVGHAEVAESTSVAVDLTPPVTQLQISSPSVAQASGTVVGPGTVLSLAAQDPLSGGVASGVKDTFLAVSTSVFALAPATFTLSGADGPRAVSYYSRDNVLNTEAVKTAAVLLDATPPVSTAAIGAPLYAAADGTQYVTPATPVTLTAADPVVNDAASGLDRIEISVDSAAFVDYVSTLTFTEGRHTVSYRAVDRVGNVEATHTLRLQSDNTPPVTALQASGSYYAAAGRNYAPVSFAYALPAQDPVVNDVASGLAATLFRVDASTFIHYVSTFSLTEGVRRVDFQSADNVGNQELLKSATVYVDAIAPLTALTIGQPRYAAPGGLLFVGPAAPFALSAQDPVVQGVASGVNAVSVRVDSAPFGLYSATFTLTPGDGLRTVGWFAADNVGNAEMPKVSTVALDATPPLTSLLVSGGRQFAGPGAATFYASADTRLVLVSTDPLAGGVASGVAFTRWQDGNGAFTTYISSLALAEGAHALAYQSQDNVANLEVLRSTNIWIDATPPATTVSIGSPTFTAADGTIYVATATPVAFAAADPNLPTGQAGSGLNRIEVSLDAAPFTPYTVVLTLAEGRHVILYRAVDNVGNIEGAHSISIQSDATPPASSLVIGAPQFQLPGVLLVSSRTSFAIAAVDPVTNNVASGVKDTSYRVSDVAPSTAAFTVYGATFAMAGADVNKVVEFRSRDNVLNAEIVKSSTVLLDSTPPEVALLSPAACDSGICRVLKGKFPVLGTARDVHFGNYQLEFAAGQNAASSFTFVSSGTAAVNSGPLGVWDATALNGWFTLRLTATDLVSNGASTAINVFVGDPGELLTLGNHEVFNMPEGVAAGSDGKIYVADRDNDRVAVFSSTGALLASFGGRGHDDDHLSTGTLTLDEPSGVAVDAAGNIYVADTDHDRVLKLSATGQVLLSLGGREREHERDDRHDDKSEGHDRRLPGRFHHPAGVAVDASQNIFVADTDNRRVQVFNSTGGFTLQFDMPLAPARPDHDDNDRHDDHDDDAAVAALGKPFGIALDAAGNIYVADSKGGRALKFGATGQLLLTIPITGDKPGTWGQPFGVAVSSSGDCLLVSDRKDSRLLKFDFQGSRNLDFGAKGKVHDDDAPAPKGAIVFNKPMGLALDGQGNLFVADRNNDRIRKFALPTGRPPLVVPAPKPGDDYVARDVVDKEDGGKVERKDLAAVDIPAGAVAQDMKVTVSTPSEGAADESSRRRAADAAQLKTASPPVEYGPEGTKFAAPVTLTLPYSSDLVALEGVDEADLAVRYWNRDKGQWENLETVVDPKTHTVKAKTTHFSLYQVFSGTATAGLRPLAVGDPTFVFHDAYAFPNPVRGTSVVTIRIQPGLADSVEVHAYDLSGRRVYSSSNFSLNPGLDDGNGKGVQYTYDNIWDISGVGSGVYLYVITAKKAGKSDIHKAGRVGVIK